MHGNSVHQSMSSWWVGWQFLDGMRTARSHNCNEGRMIDHNFGSNFLSLPRLSRVRVKESSPLGFSTQNAYDPASLLDSMPKALEPRRNPCFVHERDLRCGITQESSKVRRLWHRWRETTGAAATDRRIVCISIPCHAFSRKPHTSVVDSQRVASRHSSKHYRILLPEKKGYPLKGGS